MWSSCESDEPEPATSSVNKNRSKEGERPRTCEPTGTLLRSPLKKYVYLGRLTAGWASHPHCGIPARAERKSPAEAS
jgi:hypothetical protein